MSKKNTDKLLAALLKQRDADYEQYVSEYKVAVSKAAPNSKNYAANTYLRAQEEKLKNRWKDISNFRSSFVDAKRLDYSITFENWIIEFIIEHKCSLETCKEIGSYFAWNSFTDWVYGFDPFENVSEDDSDDQKQKSAIQETTFIWGTGTKITHLDFLKIAIGLYHSGILRTKSGTQSEFITSLAERLEYKLPDHWDTNLTKGVRYENKGFDPSKIFAQLKGGWEGYCETITKKQDKRNKI